MPFFIHMLYSSSGKNSWEVDEDIKEMTREGAVLDSFWRLGLPPPELTGENRMELNETILLGLGTSKISDYYRINSR